MPPASSVLAVGLLVEDHQILREVLDDTGMPVVTAATVREAMHLLDRDCPAVIISESNLPDGTWKDLLDISAWHSPVRNLIVVSRLADEFIWAEVLNLGGWDVLAKPLDKEEVLRSVISAFGFEIRRSMAEHDITRLAHRIPDSASAGGTRGS
jgi:DNA-binding NtrC family response regulator